MTKLAEKNFHEKVARRVNLNTQLATVGTLYFTPAFRMVVRQGLVLVGT